MILLQIKFRCFALMVKWSLIGKNSGNFSISSGTKIPTSSGTLHVMNKSEIPTHRIDMRSRSKPRYRLPQSRGPIPPRGPRTRGMTRRMEEIKLARLRAYKRAKAVSSSKLNEYLERKQENCKDAIEEEEEDDKEKEREENINEHSVQQPIFTPNTETSAASPKPEPMASNHISVPDWTPVPTWSTRNIRASRPCGKGTFGQVSPLWGADEFVVKHGPLDPHVNEKDSVVPPLNEGLMRELVVISAFKSSYPDSCQARASMFYMENSTRVMSFILQPRYSIATYEFVKYQPTLWRPHATRFFSWAIQLRDQIRSVHNQGFVHSDISVVNTLFTNKAGDEIRLVDFSATNISGIRGRMRSINSLENNLSMMYKCMEWSRSPEELFETHSLHERACDIWGYGTVLLYLLTRHVLGTNSNNMQYDSGYISNYFKFFGMPTESAWPVLEKNPVYCRFVRENQKPPGNANELAQYFNRMSFVDKVRRVHMDENIGQFQQEHLSMLKPELGWDPHSIRLALEVISCMLQWNPDSREKAFDNDEGLWKRVHEACKGKNGSNPTPLYPRNLEQNHNRNETLNACLMKPEIFQEELPPPTNQPLHTPSSRRAVVQAMSDVLFGAHYGTPEPTDMGTLGLRTASFDALVVATHVLWRYMGVYQQQQIMKKQRTKHEGTPTHLNVEFLDILTYINIHAEAVVGFQDGEWSLGPGSYSDTARSLLFRSTGTIPPEEMKPSSHTPTQRMEQTCMEITHTLQGRTVDPKSLPRLTQTSIHSFPGFTEGTATRHRILIPAFLELVEDPYWWTRLFSAEAREEVEQEFVKRARYFMP